MLISPYVEVAAVKIGTDWMVGSGTKRVNTLKLHTKVAIFGTEFTVTMLEFIVDDGRNDRIMIYVLL